MMDIWNQVVFLLLGWLLGILSQSIADGIKKEKLNSEIKQAILSELHELQMGLSLVCYTLAMQTGRYDRSFLQWHKRILEGYKGPTDVAVPIAATNQALQLTDPQIAALAAKFINKPGVSLGLKSFDTPFLKFHLGQIGAFPVRLQAHLLEVVSRLRILNEEIEQYRFYFQQTFQTGPNHSVLSGNISTCYVAVATQGRLIADTISTIATEAASS
jgi:hypothetical protein